VPLASRGDAVGTATAVLFNAASFAVPAARLLRIRPVAPTPAARAARPSAPPGTFRLARRQPWSKCPISVEKLQAIPIYQRHLSRAYLQAEATLF